MRAATTSARVLVVLVYTLVCLLAVSTSAGLAVTGYLAWVMGSNKAALFFWAVACLPLVFIGLLGSYLPEWLNLRRGTFTATHTGVTP